MNIPQFDQDIAQLQAMQIQIKNGFHISENDIKALSEALTRLNEYFKEYK
jgi:hypothetical protein